MSTPLKALIDRLTPTARRAVEGAASRALSRTHFEVEIEHVVLAILAQDDNAGVAALHSLGLSLDEFEKERDVALSTPQSQTLATGTGFGRSARHQPNLRPPLDP